MITRLSAVLVSCLVLGAAAADAWAQHTRFGGAFRSQQVPDPPIDVVVGPDRAFWVLDAGGGLSRVLGSRVERVVRSPKLSDAQTGRSVVVDGLGRLVFASRGRILRVAPDGSRTSLPLRRLSSRLAGELTRFVAGPDGTIWFGTPDGYVGRLSTSGRVRRYRVPVGTLGYPTERAPRSVAFAADGTLWFTIGSRLGRMQTDGRFLSAYPVTLQDSGEADLSVLARGADEAMWTAIDARGSEVRVAADGRQVVAPPRSDRPVEHTALGAGPQPGIWSVSGFPAESVGGTSGDALSLTAPDGSSPNADPLPTDERRLGSLSARTFGLVSGLDGRMWFTERDVSRLSAYTPSGGVGTVRRGVAFIRRATRVGGGVRTELGCVGPTGSHCVGTLRVQLAGRPIGRRVGYAVAAGPAAVRVRAARTLALSATARRSRARLSVRGTPGARAVARRG